MTKLEKSKVRNRPWKRLRFGEMFVEHVKRVPGLSEQECYDRSLIALKNSLCKFNQRYSSGVMAPVVVPRFDMTKDRNGRLFIEVRITNNDPPKKREKARVYAFYSMEPGKTYNFRLTDEELEGPGAGARLARKIYKGAKIYQHRKSRTFDFTIQTHVWGVEVRCLRV